eukprot:CAMPEP_0118894456 /NCGR_PEP_ID=MMETSP1166-20130328/3226_1 /TAXON_ID=1104430 /ORGANISM="Chrysoreinhardia sp, Strain CCMP3193" /LENGTH=108 /DNA_ID=CAMNT_0006833365 /DNA_START=228 /DNA_END=554 /DNA_ORIENTATION=+
MNKIALVYPRHRWSDCVILASVECKLGSTANMQAYLVEQVLPGEKSLAAEAPFLQKVDFHDLTGDIACTRKRVIASSLTDEQLRGKPCVVVSSLGTLRQTTQPEAVGA